MVLSIDSLFMGDTFILEAVREVWTAPKKSIYSGVGEGGQGGGGGGGGATATVGGGGGGALPPPPTLGHDSILKFNEEKISSCSMSATVAT